MKLLRRWLLNCGGEVLRNSRMLLVGSLDCELDCRRDFSAETPESPLVLSMRFQKEFRELKRSQGGDDWNKEAVADFSKSIRRISLQLISTN
jgi:hypothetical protein